MAAAGRPYILNRKPPDNIPAVGSPANIYVAVEYLTRC
ncbi:hypothetical protein LTSERUB_3090, partial [Salmonella enterica subsp. enterica serovar Rubislaw str. A4-653]